MSDDKEKPPPLSYYRATDEPGDAPRVQYDFPDFMVAIAAGFLGLMAVGAYFSLAAPPRSPGTALCCPCGLALFWLPMVWGAVHRAIPALRGQMPGKPLAVFGVVAIVSPVVLTAGVFAWRLLRF